jgi:hypothetical protein
LGPVGSQIVAETFVGILWRDPTSFLHRQVRFTPVISNVPEKEFGLFDLFKYALGG